MTPTRKLLRTLRLDASDTFVFPKAAEPGEWAVPGSFAFLDQDVAALSGKAKVAFRSGMLGVQSGGWSTLCSVVQATDAERDEAVRQLAELLVRDHGAPSMAVALAAADEEMTFAEGCADHLEQTVVVIHRKLSDDGDIREEFRTVRPGLPFNKDSMSRVFTFHEVEGEEEPEERIDLAGLTEKTAHDR